jgi:hypothetical protein
MTGPEKAFLAGLEVEVDAELTLTEASAPEDDLPIEQWEFDPLDAEREEVGLQNVLGAVRTLDDPS